MVDNRRRKILAKHLRHLSIRLISGDEFEELVMKEIAFGFMPDQYYQSPQSWVDDPAIRPILEYCWCLYDELNDRLTEKNELSKYQLKEVSRLVLFLHSEQEYDWDYVDITNPVLKFSFKDIMKSIVTFGQHYKDMVLSRQQQFEAMKQKGDFQFWPFKNMDLFESQLAKQPFLSGTAKS